MPTLSNEIEEMRKRLEAMPTVDDDQQGEENKKRDLESMQAEYESTLKKTAPLRYRNARLHDFSSNATLNIKQWLKTPQDALLLQSTTSGTGKTHMGYAVLVEMLKMRNYAMMESIQNGGEYKRGRLNNVLAVTFSNLILELKSAFDGNSSESDVIERYCKVDVLFIDDIGAEKISDYTQTVLYTIINNRYNDMRPTVISTNLSAPDIAKNYGQRMVSRMASGVVVKLDGKDRRLK